MRHMGYTWAKAMQKTIHEAFDLVSAWLNPPGLHETRSAMVSRVRHQPDSSAVVLSPRAKGLPKDETERKSDKQEKKQEKKP